MIRFNHIRFQYDFKSCPFIFYLIILKKAYFANLSVIKTVSIAAHPPIRPDVISPISVSGPMSGVVIPPNLA